MQLKEETKDLYKNLLGYCKDDKVLLADGIRADRAPTYRRLVRSIIFGNLEKAYPITKASLKQEIWHKLLSDFFAEWKIPSPELWKMPYALLEFVQETGYANKINAPYLEDLLLFEWIEIEVFMMPNAAYSEISKEGDVLNDLLQLNLESILIKLEYPVHKTNAKNIKSGEIGDSNSGEFFVLCFRHPETLSANFVELTPVAALIVELLRSSAMSAKDLFNILEGKVEQLESKRVIVIAQSLLEEFKRQNIILGFIKN
jgi:hypothetical protein